MTLLKLTTRQKYRVRRALRRKYGRTLNAISRGMRSDLARWFAERQDAFIAKYCAPNSLFNGAPGQYSGISPRTAKVFRDAAGASLGTAIIGGLTWPNA